MIQFYRGDNHSVRVTVTNANGSPADLTGGSVRLTARPSAAAEPILQVTAAIEDGLAGVVVFSLSPADTGPLPVGKAVADIEVRLADGRVYTVWKDSLTVLEDITR